MALRSLDNALPVALERPKKQAKVIAAVNQNQNQKQPEIVVNDENKAPVPDSIVDYIPSENLEPIADPDSKIQVTLFFCGFKLSTPSV